MYVCMYVCKSYELQSYTYIQWNSRAIIQCCENFT